MKSMTTTKVLTKTTADGKYELSIIKKDTLEDALDVIRKAFFIDENVSIATEVSKHPNAAKELEELCIRAAKDGVSVIAIEKQTNMAVSAFFNKIQIQPGNDEENYFEKFEASCKEPSSRALVRYMIDMEARFDVFKEKQVTCGLEIMFIGTLREHRGRQLGSQLWEFSMDIAQRLRNGENVKVALDCEQLHLEPKPDIVMALATSNVTYKIAKKFKFENLLEVSFDEFTFNGKTFSERIGPETPSSTFVCYRLK